MRRKLLRNTTLPLHGAVKDYGYFYASLYLGTPPKKFAVIVDTGSTMTYVPCATCGAACGPNHQDAAFDPRLSQTSKLISCDSDKCRCGSPHCGCSDAQQCMYTRSYAEQSSSSGILLEDEVSLHDGGPSVPVIFGCETKETGEIFKQRADGLFGLGNSDASLVNQLVAAGEIDDIFSLCFGVVEGDGVLMLGDSPAANEVGLQYTPLVPSPTHPFYYNVRLDAISVGGDQLDISTSVFQEGYATVLDSGTTFTYVPTPAFQAFASAVEAYALQHGLVRVRGPDPQYDDICFGGAPEHTDVEAMASVFPSFSLHFAPDATLTLGPLNYLFVHTFNSGKYCLGVFDNGHAGTLLGGITFRNVLVQYDRQNERVGFGGAACKELGRKHRPPCSAFSSGNGKNDLAAIVAVADGDCQQEGGNGRGHGGGNAASSSSSSTTREDEEHEVVMPSANDKDDQPTRPSSSSGASSSSSSSRGGDGDDGIEEEVIGLLDNNNNDSNTDTEDGEDDYDDSLLSEDDTFTDEEGADRQQDEVDGDEIERSKGVDGIDRDTDSEIQAISESDIDDGGLGRDPEASDDSEEDFDTSALDGLEEQIAAAAAEKEETLQKDGGSGGEVMYDDNDTNEGLSTTSIDGGSDISSSSSQDPPAMHATPLAIGLLAGTVAMLSSAVVIALFRPGPREALQSMIPSRFKRYQQLENEDPESGGGPGGGGGAILDSKGAGSIMNTTSIHGKGGISSKNGISSINGPSSTILSSLNPSANGGAIGGNNNVDAVHNNSNTPTINSKPHAPAIAVISMTELSSKGPIFSGIMGETARVVGLTTPQKLQRTNSNSAAAAAAALAEELAAIHGHGGGHHTPRSGGGAGGGISGSLSGSQPPSARIGSSRGGPSTPTRMQLS
ncbi:putative Aspartic proteinase 39 [Nannochloris sp. 'desiccata']|nr:hypothetical protein KSW81_006139 [Chlorella desiccata (nom. nud.)]KAH7619711.1 putative Aspartic proteinase 39 [Chlorella desiccata (nom. nud.)]